MKNGARLKGGSVYNTVNIYFIGKDGKVAADSLISSPEVRVPADFSPGHVCL